MLVGGDGEAFEASLVDVPHAGRAMMRVPALRMRERQPAKEVGHLLVLPLAWPDDEVPMVPHQRIAEDPQRHALEGFRQQGVEGREIGFLFEQPQPAIGPIEDMVGVAAYNGPRTPWHRRDRITGQPSPSRNDSRPLYFLSLYFLLFSLYSPGGIDSRPLKKVPLFLPLKKVCPSIEDGKREDAE